MELNFKLECLETGECTYLTEIDMERLINVCSHFNRGIYGKLRPFFKYQKKDHP
jgi:hypothetical protein